MSWDVKDKTIIVTGANSGIGFETARELARSGAKVILVCRNMRRGEEALKEIMRQTPEGCLELSICDLSDQKAIRAFAKDFKNTHERLDVLINNAAVYRNSISESPDGIELTFAVNHLGPFLLTNLLLDILEKSAPSRIVNVASMAQNPIDFENLQNRRGFSGRVAYARSKLANILFTYELSRRLNGADITVNCLHPGIINTNLFRSMPWFLQPIVDVVKNIFKSPLTGAQTSIYLASSEEVSGVSGKYFINKKPTRSHDQSYDEDVAERLWLESMRLTGLDDE